MSTLSSMRQAEDRVLHLAPDQGVPRRPFTSVSLYQRDIAVLTDMLEDLRCLQAAAEKGRQKIVPYKRIAWATHGYKRRVIVCRPERLTSKKELCVVGFFGEMRPELDVAVLEKANAEIVREFESYPGILSYSSFELPGDQWANLVLHDEPQVTERWRGSERHRRAVADLSPVHYRNVRIHNGRIPGGLPGGRWIVINRTKYWDYRAKTIWHAVRDLPTPIKG